MFACVLRRVLYLVCDKIAKDRYHLFFPYNRSDLIHSNVFYGTSYDAGQEVVLHSSLLGRDMANCDLLTGFRLNG